MAALLLTSTTAISAEFPDPGGDPVTCIDLVKTGPETAMPGETVTYYFEVENCGEVVLHGAAQVYDPLFGSDAIFDEVVWPGQVFMFEKDYTLPDRCEPFTNNAWAVGHPLYEGEYLPNVYDYASWTIEVICEPPLGTGTGTPGYWMNHPDAWPVNEIVIGGMNYVKADAIALMEAPVKGDKTLTMFPALVSAKLNVLIGNEASCIQATIDQADAWMVEYPVQSGVKGKSPAWKDGEPLYETLDAYNNGELCAPHRD
jgi:hypothetical protein